MRREGCCCSSFVVFLNFCYVLLLASNEVCFSFFMVVTVLDVDQTEILQCLELVMDGM